MKSSQAFKFVAWTALVYACAMLWAFIVYRPWLLIVYFCIGIACAILAFCLMQHAKKNGL